MVKLKIYAALALAVVTGFFGLLLQNTRLKKKATEHRLKAAEKQLEQSTKTIYALNEAEKEASENVQKAVERARSGKRDHFK